MQAIKQCMQLIRRHKKANGLLESTAWGCLFSLQKKYINHFSVIPCKLPAVSVSAPPATETVPQQKKHQMWLKLTS